MHPAPPPKPKKPPRLPHAVDPDDARKALAATKGFAGASGVTTIDKDRNATKGATIIAIKNGKLVFHKTVEP